MKKAFLVSLLIGFAAITLNAQNNDKTINNTALITIDGKPALTVAAFEKLPIPSLFEKKEAFNLMQEIIAINAWIKKHGIDTLPEYQQDLKKFSKGSPEPDISDPNYFQPANTGLRARLNYYYFGKKFPIEISEAVLKKFYDEYIPRQLEVILTPLNLKVIKFDTQEAAQTFYDAVNNEMKTQILDHDFYDLKIEEKQTVFSSIFEKLAKDQKLEIKEYAEVSYDDQNIPKIIRQYLNYSLLNNPLFLSEPHAEKIGYVKGNFYVVGMMLGKQKKPSFNAVKKFIPALIKKAKTEESREKTEFTDNPESVFLEGISVPLIKAELNFKTNLEYFGADNEKQQGFEQILYQGMP